MHVHVQTCEYVIIYIIHYLLLSLSVSLSSSPTHCPCSSHFPLSFVFFVLLSWCQCLLCFYQELGWYFAFRECRRQHHVVAWLLYESVFFLHQVFPHFYFLRWYRRESVYTSHDQSTTSPASFTATIAMITHDKWRGNLYVKNSTQRKRMITKENVSTLKANVLSFKENEPPKTKKTYRPSKKMDRHQRENTVNQRKRTGIQGKRERARLGMGLEARQLN